VRQLVLTALLALLPAIVQAGAPHVGGRFVNLAGPRPRPSFGTMWGFLLSKAWQSFGEQTGGAASVPFDRAALGHNPSLTWIGHATFLVRMDGVTFLTDPMFSERASPVGFAGPKRHQPPGVPLDQLPPIDFVVISHNHYDHTDTASIEALAKRGARFFVRSNWVGWYATREVVELDWWQMARWRHRSPAFPRNISPGCLTDEMQTLWAGWAVSDRRGAFTTPATPATSTASPRCASASARSTSRRCRSAPTIRPRSCSSST
jgi:N-acyl-phosphatidylethanolamine-hydrolysing phospholipase D